MAALNIAVSVLAADVARISRTLVGGRIKALREEWSAKRLPLYRTRSGRNQRLCPICALWTGALKQGTDRGKRRSVRGCERCTSRAET